MTAGQSPVPPDFAARLAELRAAAMETTVDTGPEPVYEPTEAAERAYYECQQFLWLHAEAILGLVRAAIEWEEARCRPRRAPFGTGTERIDRAKAANLALQEALEALNRA